MKNNAWIWVVIALLVVAGAAYFAFWPVAGTTTDTNPSVQGTTTVSSFGWPVFSNEQHGFSISYPPDFGTDIEYSYTGMGPGKEIEGVSFTIPASLAAGTNLSPDTKISVEWLPATTCTAASFLDGGQKLGAPTDTVYTFDVLTSSEGAAGNRYEEVVYALPQCIAIRYFIHSTVLENYPAGTVTAFDRTHLLEIFDAMRRSFIVDHKG